MRTISRHLPRNRPYGDYEVRCDLCGVTWYRSQMRKDRAGRLRCPDDREGRDPVTLSELNAAAAARPPRRGAARDGGGHDVATISSSSAAATDYSTLLDLRAGLNPADAVLDSNGRVSTVASGGSASGNFYAYTYTLNGKALPVPGWSPVDDRFGGRPVFLGNGLGARLRWTGDALWAAGEAPYVFIVARFSTTNGNDLGLGVPQTTAGWSALFDVTGAVRFGSRPLGGVVNQTYQGVKYYPYDSNLDAMTQVFRVYGQAAPAIIDTRAHVFEFDYVTNTARMDGEPIPGVSIDAHSGALPASTIAGQQLSFTGFTGVVIGGTSAASSIIAFPGQWGRALFANDVSASSALAVRKKLAAEYNITLPTGTPLLDRTVKGTPGCEPYLVDL